MTDTPQNKGGGSLGFGIAAPLIGGVVAIVAGAAASQRD